MLNFIEAFLVGHEEFFDYKNPSGKLYGLEQFLKDYERWIKIKTEYENSEHFGNCTKQPSICMRCYIDEYKEKAEKFEK